MGNRILKMSKYAIAVVMDMSLFAYDFLPGHLKNILTK